MQEFILLFFMAAMVMIGAASIRYRKAPGAFSLLAMSAIIMGWSVAYLLYILKWFSFTAYALTAVEYFCVTVTATAQLVFSLYYSGRGKWINRLTLSVLLLQPILIQLFFWTRPFDNALPIGPDNVWARFTTLYIVGLLSASIVLFFDAFMRKPRPLFARSGVIVGASLPPCIVSAIAIMEVNISMDVFLSIASHSLAALGFAYGLYSSWRVEVEPIARDVAVEGMDDGWLVVDAQGKVVDLNSAAEEMIGTSRDKIYGQPIDLILSDWQNIIKTSGEIKELEMKRVVKTLKDWRYLNVRISQLIDSNNVNFGHLVVWRDVTKRKLAEDARQRARDELFILLNAISSAASQSMNLDAFLTESIYQIIYSFHSQAVAVFLMDHESRNTSQTLSLASHVGLTSDIVKVLSSSPSISFLTAWLNGEGETQPLVVDAMRNGESLPKAMQEMGFSNFIFISLVVRTRKETSILGCLCLARSDNAPYTQDEVIRLATIASQIATLIDSDRRRQFAIVLSERQRLLRDLHDSVSQKLYGLVALTEAAQAALDVGSSINPPQVLEKIGENARQAVKEMRLFLYEMQPVGLEEEGLVSVLHHRLAAVEGRADIKARMLADETISLSKNKETALFFIAQEALNNILRHAHAKNVLITLKQTRQNVVLEIKDDGRGFDINTLERGGLGLNNMKERARQIKGRFKISSKPGAGTMVVAMVNKKD